MDMQRVKRLSKWLFWAALSACGGSSSSTDVTDDGGCAGKACTGFDPELDLVTVPYQFEPEDQPATERELTALTGDWYSQLPWIVDDVSREIFTTGFSFLLPDYAGVASWRATNLTSARQGQLRFQAPSTNRVTIGKPLGSSFGPLSGFRPMQFATQETPERPEWTVLYQRGTSPDLGSDTDAARPVLLVAYCPSIQTSGGDRPSIEDCPRDSSGAWRQIYSYGRTQPR